MSSRALCRKAGVPEGVGIGSDDLRRLLKLINVACGILLGMSVSMFVCMYRRLHASDDVYGLSVCIFVCMHVCACLSVCMCVYIYFSHFLIVADSRHVQRVWEYFNPDGDDNLEPDEFIPVRNHTRAHSHTHTPSHPHTHTLTHPHTQTHTPAYTPAEMLCSF